MTTLAAFFSTHTLDNLLSNYGYAAVFVFVMVESLGVPFPGETMVIVAALYAGHTHNLTVEGIWLAASAGAIIGDNIGYAIGFWGGFRLLLRYGGKIHINEARIKVGILMFARYGGRVVFFGRFISVLRTYAAFLAGTNRMHWRRFFLFNASGGIVWAAIYSFGFYYAGSALKGSRGTVDYALGAAAAVVVIGFLVWLRRNERRLEKVAEAAYPGPLEADQRSVRDSTPSQAGPTPSQPREEPQP